MRATASSGGEDRTARVSGLFLLVGAAAITGGWHALYAAAMLVDGRVRPGAFVGVVVPLSVSLALVAGIGWLRRTGVSAGSVYRAGMWTVGCGLLASLLGTAVLVHQAANGVLMVERPYVVVSLATGGAGAGFLVGVYDARLLASVRRLSAERERTGQLEQRLRVLNRVLRHDIRNDANVIRGYAELLDGSDPAEAIDRRAADLVHTGENARYVEELIDADRLAAERVDATGIAADAVAAVGAGFPDVHVELATSGRAVASANRLLHAAVENVVENAAEHNDAEEPWVEVRVSADAEWVTIEVADNGPGIPETEVAVLSRGAETPLRHSSGLGLWLVNWVVGDCGGRVDFHEREPRGSVVALELPAAGDAT